MLDITDPDLLCLVQTPENVPLSLPPHPKWDGMKNVKYFEGNTLLCPIPPSSPQFGLLVAAQNVLKHSTIGKYFAFLPPSSFHMTVYDLVSSDSGGKPWKEIHKEMYKKCQTILTSAPWTIFRMDYQAVRDDCSMVILKPNSSICQSALNNWRSAINQETNVPMNNRYYFHVTWAYVLQPVMHWTVHERSELETVHRQQSALLQSWNSLDLINPRFCVFNDMSEFFPLNAPFDFNCIVGFDAVQQRAGFLKAFGDSSVKDLETHFVTWQTNDPGTIFVPIFEKEKMFLLSYSPTFGNVWIHRIYSSFNRHCIGQYTWEPDWSHFIFLLGHLIVYNQSTGKLKKLVLRINEEGNPVWSEKNTWMDFPGASSIMAFEIQGKTLILLYFNKGKAHITDGHGFNKVFQWSTGWTHFVPLTRDQSNFVYLAYKASTGQTNVTQFSANMLNDLNKTTLPTNLAHIVCFSMSGRLHLLLFPFATQGKLMLYRIESDYSLTLVSNLFNPMNSTWTQLTPLDLNQLIRFD